MKNYRQIGDCIRLTAPADVLSGEVVVVGGLTGVATGDAKSGEALTVQRRGVFRLPTAPGVNFAEGDDAYWLETDKQATDVDGGGANVLIGYAVCQNECPAGFADILLP